MRLSQGQLNLLETCPRKFQHVYLEQLTALLPLEQQERLSWGNRFHLLVQQHELGLPSLPLPAIDEPLRQRVQAFIQMTPDLFQSDPTIVRQSEYQLSLVVNGYVLTTIYDLLILHSQSAEILDWKTYPRPEQHRSLAQNWQTRLYSYLLVETMGYLPDQITMTYWFVQGRGDRPPYPNPESLTFAYDASQHDQNRQDLVMLLSQLTNWLQRYTLGEEFPQVRAETGHCQFCPFATRCQRIGSEEPDQESELPSLADIEEVVL